MDMALLKATNNLALYCIFTRLFPTTMALGAGRHWPLWQPHWGTSSAERGSCGDRGSLRVHLWKGYLVLGLARTYPEEEGLHSGLDSVSVQ